MLFRLSFCAILDSCVPQNVISLAARAFLMRLRMKKLLQKVVIVQAACRGFLAKRAAKEARDAKIGQQVVLLQSAFRALKARQLTAKVESAAVRIQSVWRGHVARKQTSKQIAQMRIQIEITRQQTKKVRNSFPEATYAGKS